MDGEVISLRNKHLRNKHRSSIRACTRMGITVLVAGLTTMFSGFIANTVQAKQEAQQKVLYFTFDDGPGALYTPQILDVLRREHVHATFFVLGSRCTELPDVMKRMQREGHEIGSHGYDHRNLAHVPEHVIRSEVQMADTAIVQVTGKKPRYFRPAYGAIDRRELPMILQMGHPVVFWTVDSLDWKATSAASIIHEVKTWARPGSIVLFHDGVSQSRYTVQALPVLIRYYRTQGYVFKVL
ncbi:polysaccharide deacetylase family protein [Alicyclobacillus acidiphilus]|uniref:polysaccharide deacetylase family protein n=1 Tax=Alicyclobacillus acidiphilus TaxID=182455 RepID=UPI0008376A26|nr:polysaccharide deacetylase family protein [Alicyclobacillus acidiphilus]